MQSRKNIKLLNSKSDEKELSEQNPSTNKISMKLEKIQKIVSLGKDYTMIKFKHNIYSVGDTLLVRDLNEGFLIAKLLRILSYNGNKKYPYWPTIEVQWYIIN